MSNADNFGVRCANGVLSHPRHDQTKSFVPDGVRMMPSRVANQCGCRRIVDANLVPITIETNMALPQIVSGERKSFNEIAIPVRCAISREVDYKPIILSHTNAFPNSVMCLPTVGHSANPATGKLKRMAGRRTGIENRLEQEVFDFQDASELRQEAPRSHDLYTKGGTEHDRLV